MLTSLKPIETDEMLRTLNTTNNNIEKVTGNLYEITTKLNSSNSLWSLLSDTVIMDDLRTAVAEFKKAGINVSDLTYDGKKLISTLEKGDGLVKKLFTDTLLTVQLSNSIDELNKASRQSTQMMNELRSVVTDLKQGEGTAGLILADTSLRQSLFRSATNIEEGTYRFNQNMEALKTHFLFRGYFKKLEKEERKNTKQKTE